jgi:hypothetical protein
VRGRTKGEMHEASKIIRDGIIDNRYEKKARTYTPTELSHIDTTVHIFTFFNSVPLPYLSIVHNQIDMPGSRSK